MDQVEWWAEFKIFQDRDGRYYWHLEAASGRIIAQSGHPYESKYWCEQDVNWLRTNAGLIRVYDYARDKAPSYTCIRRHMTRRQCRSIAPGVLRRHHSAMT